MPVSSEEAGARSCNRTFLILARIFAVPLRSSLLPGSARFYLPGLALITRKRFRIGANGLKDTGQEASTLRYDQPTGCR